MRDMKQLLVIIPTYNEAQNISKIISETFKACQSIPHWSTGILVVDDNSPDGTSKIVKEMQKVHKNLYMLLGKKVGLGKAYLRGLTYGLDNKYDALVIMDADFSHDPN